MVLNPGQSAQQPQKLQIALASRSSSPARLHAVEVAVDVELQENRRVEGGSSSRCGLNTVEPEIGEIERVDEGIDHADGVFLVDPIVKALW